MIEIRKAYPIDASVLVKIRDLAWKADYYDVLTNEIIHDKDKNVLENIRHLEEQIRENNRILVAVDGDKIVGFVFYAKVQGDSYDNAEIREIYVLPDYQRKGIGKKLFDGAVNELKRLRYTSFIVSCPIHNKSMDFFIHLGGIKKGNKTEKMYGHAFVCEVIYFDIVSSDNSSLDNEWNQLYIKAQEQVLRLNDFNKEVAVLLSDSGHYYLGIGIGDKVCPIEGALSSMYLSDDRKISKILIMNKTGKLVLPCGKCRDLLIRLGDAEASILFDYDSLKTMTMRELNPYYKDSEKNKIF